jgi:hypothetical protein
LIVGCLSFRFQLPLEPRKARFGLAGSVILVASILRFFDLRIFASSRRPVQRDPPDFVSFVIFVITVGAYSATVNARGASPITGAKAG